MAGHKKDNSDKSSVYSDEISNENNDNPWLLVGKNGRPIKRGTGNNNVKTATGKQSEKDLEVVVKPRQFTRRKRHRVHGSRQGEVLEGAPPPRRDFFLSRVKRDTDDDVLKKYITEKACLCSL